ncbi:hypothetical protein [Actinosynnema sp. NPDC023587]|uniref:hypothetical protein n=1 Tax=Actinosynnema sp. NPDC023587 TaxID=3154695 RepID=UPI003401AB45
MTLRGTSAITATLLLLVAACGSEQPSDTPESVLSALAKAGNDRDDETIRKLVCPEEWREDLTFAATKSAAVDEDPNLKDLTYRFTDSGVKDKTDTTATGRLDVEVEGVPDGSSSVLDRLAAPLPIALYSPDQNIGLVKRDGGWVACR